MTSSQKNIPILGGSYGGISTAHQILKHSIPKLPNKETYKVILISTSSQAFCRPACPRAMISDSMFAQEKLFVSITQQFSQYPSENFRFLQGTATKLDHLNRIVSIALPDGLQENIEFYALVIATGASTPSPLLSLNQDETHLRSSWSEFRKALPTAKSIVIAGGGPAGIETAGELGEHLNGRAGWFRNAPHTVEITVVTSASKILPALRPSLAIKAEKYLSQLRVRVIKNAKVVSVSPEGAGLQSGLLGSKAMVTLSDGQAMEADIFIPAYGTQPNTNFVDKSLLASNGRIETNISTLRVDNAGPRVYAIGDCSSYAAPAIHNLLEAIPILGANIKKDLFLAEGMEVGEDRVFVEDKRETHMVPIGKSKGVGAAMGWALPSFLIWLIKGRDYWLWTTGSLWSGKQWAKEQ